MAMIQVGRLPINQAFCSMRIPLFAYRRFDRPLDVGNLAQIFLAPDVFRHNSDNLPS